MKAIRFSSHFDICGIRLDGNRGKYKLFCEFSPFAQKEFLLNMEETFEVFRVAKFRRKDGTFCGMVEFTAKEKKEQQVVDEIDYIYQRYIYSGL